MWILSGYLILINLVTWAVYGLDKWKARRDAWRVPERVLLTLTLLGGSLGALAAMFLFHHKTRKPKFSVGVPLILLLYCILIFWAAAQGWIPGN